MQKISHFLLIILFCTAGFSQNLYDTKKMEFNDFYTSPITSPNGEFALVTGQQFIGIYLLELKTKKITPISITEANGYGYSWASDNETIFYKVKPENGYVMDSEVFSFNIKNKKTSKLAVDHNYLPSYQGEEKVVVYTNIRTLQIEAIDLSTMKSWVVTNNDGQFYSATLSHDGKKVAVHEGSELFVYNIDGSGIIAKLGQGIATSWSYDDNFLLGYLSESNDGHVISNSDLYLFDVKNEKASKITNTKDVFESNVSFLSKDQIIYADEKTGDIIISKIKF
ncbi:TolB family protein [Flavobacterium ardleyense]|uniref:TolB family protein n=1 Tax=Flavobacterium ardleyense TaxID=2038737 RepID=A0ABW5ZC07_9FLAO